MAINAPREIKSTGIARKLDSLGRIVVPKELRDTLGIANGDAVEIFVNAAKGEVILHKYEPACHFCNENTQDLTTFRARRICESCLEELFNQTNG